MFLIDLLTGLDSSTESVLSRIIPLPARSGQQPGLGQQPAPVQQSAGAGGPVRGEFVTTLVFGFVIFG